MPITFKALALIPSATRYALAVKGELAETLVRSGRLTPTRRISITDRGMHVRPRVPIGRLVLLGNACDRTMPAVLTGFEDLVTEPFDIGGEG